MISWPSIMMSNKSSIQSWVYANLESETKFNVAKHVKQNQKEIAISILTNWTLPDHQQNYINIRTLLFCYYFKVYLQMSKEIFLTRKVLLFFQLCHKIKNFRTDKGKSKTYQSGGIKIEFKNKRCIHTTQMLPHFHLY